MTSNYELEEFDLFTELQILGRNRFMASDPPSPVDHSIRHQEMKRLHHVLCHIVTAMLDPVYPLRATQRRFKPRTDPDVAVEA